MSKENTKSEGLYYTVIDGTFRRRVPDGTEGATRREYETKDGAKAVKYEMVIDSLEGKIEDMFITEGDFGRILTVKLDPNEKGINPHVQFSVESTYGEDVLKKIPNVDFSKEIRFRPFAFTDQTNGKEVRGVEIKQGEEKMTNFFWDSENKKPINGLPQITDDPDTMTKDDWKIHFMTVRKHLINYFTEKIVPKLQTVPKSAPAAHPDLPDYPEEEINPEDVPF